MIAARSWCSIIEEDGDNPSNVQFKRTLRDPLLIDSGASPEGRSIRFPPQEEGNGGFDCHHIERAIRAPSTTRSCVTIQFEATASLPPHTLQGSPYERRV